MIHGLHPGSLIDYPGKVAAVLFTGGCNYRCPFCHNSTLVLPERFPPELQESELLSFLNKRREFLDGITFTGGEPSIHDSLPGLLSRIRETGLPVKLDTNGSRPEMIRELLDRRLIDYVAMDIKTVPENYPRLTGGHPFTPVAESVSLLAEAAIGLQFRTTVIPELHTRDQILQLARDLPERATYRLQPFRMPQQPLCPHWNSAEMELQELQTLQEEVDSIRKVY